MIMWLLCAGGGVGRVGSSVRLGWHFLCFSPFVSGCIGCVVFSIEAGFGMGWKALIEEDYLHSTALLILWPQVFGGLVSLKVIGMED